MGPTMVVPAGPHKAAASRSRGLLYGLAAPICFSVGGMVMRQVDATGWDMVFWRSFGHGATLLPLLWLWHGGARLAGGIRAAGWIGLCSTALLAAASVFHILSMASTGVANTLVLQSTSPFMAASLAWLVLGERVGRLTWAAIAFALAGIAPILLESPGRGNFSGDLLALGVAAFSAINVILIRWRPGIDLLPAAGFGGFVAAAIALTMGAPFAIPSGDAAALFALGAFQNTLGFTCFVLALRHLPAADVTLLALLETVLGSAWVWIFLGEAPSGPVLAGGIAVLASVTAIVLSQRR